MKVFACWHVECLLAYLIPFVPIGFWSPGASRGSAITDGGITRAAEAPAGPQEGSVRVWVACVC